MPYDNTIKDEAAYVASLGSTATEDKFGALYIAILFTWFSTSEGYGIDHQVLGGAGKRKYIVIRRAGGHRNPLLIVELTRPANWNDAGKQEILRDLTEYIEGQFDLTQYNTIYGLGGIGLHWMVCKMEKGGPHAPTTVLDWHNDISSNQSYDIFKTVAELVYNMH